MKKILLVAPYGGVPGGISRWTSHIVDYHRQFKAEECELGLVSTGRSVFVNIHMPLWKRIWYALVDYRSILSDFNRKIRMHYDVMHLTSSGSLGLLKDLYMLRRAKRFKVKSIIHFRFGRIPELLQQNNWEWRLVVKAIRLADNVIVIDQQTYDTLTEQGFSNIEYLPNPVAPFVEKVVQSNSNIVREPGQILFVGHVVKTKGIFELLEACSTLADIHLKVVGTITPAMWQEIENLYGNPSWLSLCGELPYEDVIKEMQRCDIFVLPTYTEGFPNVILEAMAAGCAIISTPVGAIPQMLEDDESGKYGVLVPAKDAVELSKSIVSLIGNSHLKEEMRTNVQQRVSTRYNISSVWERMFSIWTRL